MSTGSPYLDNIAAVAARCVAECASQFNTHVSQLLCSFVVRAVSFQDPVRFDLGQPLSASDFLELTKLSVQRVLAVDSPSLETIKLQVLFHSVYSAEERKLVKKRLKRDEAAEAALNNIIELSGRLKNEQQVTNLYRHIFQYLLVNGYVDAIDRTVEREIAAALESIFPKFGLKAFCDMSVDDRKKQLRELVHIVLGIRLYNRAVNKGGAGFTDVFKVVGGEVNNACNALADETQAAYDDTLRYTEVINFEYRRPGSITAPAARLQDELAHRRQYMAYLRQLQAESLEVSSMIEQTSQTFEDQMNLFKKLIGDRPSVPKEEVYPRFQMFARLWIAVSEERDKSAVRRNVYSELRGARDAFKVALTEHDLNLALRSPPNEADDAYVQAEVVAADQLQSVPLSDGLDTALASDPTHALFTRVTRLSAQSAPDLFMQLPMEFQGFCAWSIVHRACLLPGNPSVGLLRYRGKYYSFAEAAGMAAFVADPEKYVRGVLAEAQRRPELIHLVRLQDSLPHTAIAGFIEGYGQHPDFKSLFDDQPIMCVDAGTETPTHFVERHIDINYDWNEWTLRKKALQLANLRNKKTTSIQTNMSHFRRDSETQAYLQAPLADGTMPGTGTMTGISAATNTTRVHAHLAGLRGRYDNTPETVAVDMTAVIASIQPDRSALMPNKVSKGV